MKTIIGMDPSMPERIDKIMMGFVHIREGMIVVGQSAAEASRTLEAVSARLPRSFTSLDAMHWTPPTDGQAVPPCLA